MSTADERSDMDLLVRMDTGRSLIDLIGFEQEIGDALGLYVDVVEEGGLHPMLETTVLREARTL
jgi:predicted nucleotidyltransferase